MGKVCVPGSAPTHTESSGCEMSSLYTRSLAVVSADGADKRVYHAAPNVSVSRSMKSKPSDGLDNMAQSLLEQEEAKSRRNPGFGQSFAVWTPVPPAYPPCHNDAHKAA